MWYVRKVQTKKNCDLFKRELCYVGRVIAEESYQMNPKEVQTVQLLKKAKRKTVREVRSLVSFLGYYRSFIADFSRIAPPHYELLSKTEKKSMKKGHSPTVASISTSGVDSTASAGIGKTG